AVQPERGLVAPHDTMRHGLVDGDVRGRVRAGHLGRAIGEYSWQLRQVTRERPDLGGHAARGGRLTGGGDETDILHVSGAPARQEILDRPSGAGIPAAG